MKQRSSGCVFCIVALVMLCSVSSRAQQFRVETDPLPFVLKGWVLALAGGTDTWQLRVLDARVDKPAFLIPAALDQNRIHSNAVLIDYHLPKYVSDDLILSLGVVHWEGSIRNIDLDRTERYHSILISSGIALCFYLDKHFYLSPWAGLHVLVGGDRLVNFSSSAYSLPVLNPEASIRIGYRFTI